MPTDLTRFDFQALRFRQSETVLMMTAEEVGQYVLLLVEAWLSQKNASLPDNPAILARYARVKKVSDLVMSMWTKGADGRLYNESLSEEWAVASSRSEAARERANKRWHPSGDTGAMPEQCASIMPHHAQPEPNRTNPEKAGSYQAESSRTESAQAKPISSGSVSGAEHKDTLTDDFSGEDSGQLSGSARFSEARQGDPKKPGPYTDRELSRANPTR